MDTEKPTYSFSVKQEGADYVFTYSPAKHSAGAALAALPIIVLVSLGSSCYLNTRGSGSDFDWTAFVLGASLLAGVLYGAAMLVMNSTRTAGTFTVGPAGIKKHDKWYDRTHITSLFIDPPGDGMRNATYVSSGESTRIWKPGTAAGAYEAVSKSASRAFNDLQQSASAAGVNYKRLSEWSIGLRFGETDKEIAVGLREGTARVLFDRVMEAWRATDSQAGLPDRGTQV